MGKRVAEKPRRAKKAKRRSVWKRPLPYVLIGVGLIVLSIAGVGLWVGSKALQAKDELEAAIPLADTIKASLLANEPEKAASQLGELQDHTSAAVEITNDPLWRFSENVPVFGSNLTAVREAAGVVNYVSETALAPVVELAGTIDIGSFKPIDGQINLQPIIDAQDSVAVADDAVREALDQAKAIDTKDTIGQVTDAVAKLEAVLGDASETLASVRTTVNLLPGMLGVNGPRNYLLEFQNNAEARTLGGNPASLALIHVDNGRIDLVRQGGSGTLVQGTSVIQLDPNVLALYENNYAPNTIAGYIQHTTMIPDFETAAILAKAFWEVSYGDQVDAVVSFDPVALSYLIRAMGDVTMENGDVLTADNAVAVLLSDVYARYPEGRDQDVYFADAARSVFNKVKSGDGDSKALLAAMAQSVNEGRLMVWSAVKEEEDVIRTTDFSGILPLDNDKNTVVGVYFNDLSGAKLDYYLDAAVNVSAPVCQADGFTTVSTVTLTSRVPQDAGEVLPPYVYGATPDGIIQIDIVALGPIGSTFTTFADPSQVYLINQGIDKGRQVVRIRIAVPPGGTSTASITMQSPPGVYGPLKVKTTPLVTPTKLTTETC